MEASLNRLLQRQIKRHFGAVENIPAELKAFMVDVSETYKSRDEEAKLFQNVLDISSLELREAFAKQKEDSERRKGIILKIKEAIYALNPLKQDVPHEQGDDDTSFFFNSLIELIEEHKRIEMWLKESETRMRAITESAQDAILMMDTRGCLSFWNPAAERIFGYSKDEVIGKNLHQLIAPKRYHAQHEAAYADFLRSGHGNAINTLTELEAIKKGGEELTVELSLSAIQLKDGWHAVGILRDITERKLAGQALQQSIKKWEATIAASPDGIGMISLDGKLQLMSDKMASIFGFSMEEKATKIGSSILEFIDPSNHKMLYENIHRLLTENSDHKITEYLAVKKDKSRFYIDVNSSVLLDVKGNPESILFVGRDITTRKRDEEILKQTSTRLALATRAGGVGVWDLNLSDNTLLWDSQMFALYGITGTETELSYEYWMQFIHSDDRERVDIEVQVAIMGEREFDTEFRVVWRDGSIYNIRALASIQRDNSGNPLRMIGTNWDITSQKKVELALHDSETMQRLLLDNLPVGVVIIDPVTQIIERVNDHVTVLFGSPVEDLVGHKCHSLLCSASAFQCPVCNLGLIVDNAERQMLRKDGSTLPILKTVKRVNLNGSEKLLECFVDVSERKRAEDKLKESEANFRTFFESMDDIIMVGNLQGELFFTNQVATKKLGYSNEELKSMHLFDLHPASMRLEAEEIFGQMFKGERETSSLPLARNDGSFLPVETRIWFGQWDGKDCVFGLSKDISKEQESLRKFNKIFDNNPTLMAISSIPDRIFTEVNQAFLARTGFSKEQVIGKTAQELDIFVEVEKQQEIATELDEIGFVHNCELKVRTKSGEILTSLYSGEMIESHGNNYFLTVMADITENKKLEEDIRLQNDFYNIVAKLSERLIQSDSERLDIDINHSLEILSQFNEVDKAFIFELDSDNDLISNTYEWCAPGTKSEIQDLQGMSFSFITKWKETFLKNDYICIESVVDLPSDRQFEREVFEPKGIKSLIALPMYYGSSLIGFISFDSMVHKKHWKDQVITLLKIYANVLAGVINKKKTEATLLKAKQDSDIASKAKSEFLANMSHEIRTPLNGIIGFTDLLMRTPLNVIQQQYAENVNTSGHSLLGIINDILDFSKIEAGKMELDMIKADLIELVEQTSDIIKYHVSQKGLEFLLNIRYEVPRFAIVDPQRLKQILINLLGNAVKFTESGEIELKVTFVEKDASTGSFTFNIRDTGIGINPEQQKKLFQAFSQADSSTTRKFGGTGLGLTISNMLALKMGSKIELLSEPGEGSNFFFTLETQFEYGEKLGENSLSDIKSVMVIDDNDNNRLILEHTFQNWGIQFTGFDNGLSALKYIEKSKPFDVIIVDYHMPYLNGLETIGMIRGKLNLTPEIQPIVLLHSSSDDLKIYDECKKLGVKFNLTKPVKSQELLHYLKNLNVHTISELKSNEKSSVAEIADFSIDNAPTILVAEDVLMNMLLITTSLKLFIPNVKIIEAKNGKEALDAAKSKKPDLIFMDVQMPVMSGLEATMQIRNYEKGTERHVPIIALTAGAIKEEKEKCFNAGMDDFITKPIEQTLLLTILKKYLTVGDTQTEELVQQENISGNHGHFDLIGLMQNIGNNQSLLKELIELVPEQFSSDMALLKNAINQNDKDDIKKAAHSIKGASFSMCFNQLAQMAQDMELNIETDTPTTTESKFNALISEWEHIIMVLKGLSL